MFRVCGFYLWKKQEERAAASASAKPCAPDSPKPCAPFAVASAKPCAPSASAAAGKIPAAAQNREEKPMKIAIANDHAATALKNHIKAYLEEKGYEIVNFGTDTEESVDYPIYAHKVCRAIQEKRADKGILICGTGLGMSMAANKEKGIRAALCSEPFSAKFARQHNDANVLCMGARVIGTGIAREICDIFLTEEFAGGHHSPRLQMIQEIEDGTFGD